MSKTLTHITPDGTAQMVNVADKPVTHRRAKASATVKMAAATAKAIKEANLPKGDCLTTARLAGIMAAKQTSQLIPLCHPLGLDDLQVAINVHSESVTITTEATTNGRTGVEMEALTAASVAALTIYDMAKAIDRSMHITDVMLLEKHGGASGSWIRGAHE